MVADMVGSKTVKSQWNETVSYYGDHTFMKFISVNDEVSSFTYREFDRKVKQAANFFLVLGICKEELVALHLHNKPEYVICWLALAEIGAVSVPVNEHFQIDECRYILQKCAISRVITEPCRLNIYIEHYDELNLNTLILADGHCQDSRVLLLEREMALLPVSLNAQVSVSAGENAVILFTSGTTKHPKGALYTHCNVIYGGLFHCAQIGMRSEDIFLTSMPCYHMDFQEMAMAPVICAGATLVMIEHYSARRFWRQICEHKANFTDTMSIMNRTMMLQPIKPWEKEHQLKEIYFSMGLSTEEKEAFEERFQVRLLNSYGMTETVSAVTCVPLYGDQHWPSVGCPAISYEIKIIDENGNMLPAGSEGEICIHGTPGRSIIPGYYKDEEATKRLIDKDGWIHSGDWGYLDKDGWLFFLGRCGDMIKRSGENISCVEIECILTSHPVIVDAAVVGVPDPIRDQAVKAFVKLADGTALTADEIAVYCKNHLACFKVPEFVEFVKDFPRTATGKIKKSKLPMANQK